MAKSTLTEKQRAALVKAVRQWTPLELWIRASCHGERVTLASLHSRGFLERRARRGVEGEADAAYEYKPAEIVLTELARKQDAADAVEAI